MEQRLIDADRLKEVFHRNTGNAFDDLIDAAPTIEAVPVIRCKDCKYYNHQQHYCEGIGNWFGYDDEWSDNGYCYKAERKEE